jgi:2-dehydro-3-deoxygluconokinase
MIYDLVSLGEVMLRMSPPRFHRLRRATTLDVYVAGSQLNVAANLARLGKQTAFLSKLPDNELGMLAYDTCASYGVEMRFVHMMSGTRIGVNYLEFTATPRTGVTVYDRQNSAASTIKPEDFDWVEILKQTRIAHTDGILPGLSDGCREAAKLYLETARVQDCITSFDVNYREHLWTEERARACWQSLLPNVDIVVTNRSVSESVFGYGGSDEDIFRHYQGDFGCKLICLTSREILGVLNGAWKCVALIDGQVVQGRRYEFDVIDRFGTGDAFVAGLLYSYLERPADIEFAVNFGSAACALAHTIEGDIAHLSPGEVTAILSGDYNLRVRR